MPGTGVHDQWNTHSPTALQRTDPTKSDVSTSGKFWSMSQNVCPLPARERLTKSTSTPFRRSSHRTNSGLDSRLWIATPVLMPSSWRRTGKRTSLTGGLAPPRPRRCREGQSGASRRWDRPNAPSPTPRSPRPWVEIVSSPGGSIAVRTVLSPFRGFRRMDDPVHPLQRLNGLGLVRINPISRAERAAAGVGRGTDAVPTTS